jgi:hypothetical protein
MQGCGDLSYDQVLRLERALEVFSKAYKRVGRLSDEDIQVRMMAVPVSLRAHALFEQSN